MPASGVRPPPVCVPATVIAREAAQRQPVAIQRHTPRGARSAVAALACLLLALLASAAAGDTGRTGFTPIAPDGTELAPGAAIGGAASNWACSRDHRTGLVWEVKTTDAGLRDRRWTYTPYDGNPQTNDGYAGYRDASSGKCLRARMDGGSCNTEAYVAAVNASGLCGYADWRLPTRSELVGVSMATSSAAPGDPAVMLPNTASGWYWSGVERTGAAAFSRVILLPPGGQPTFYDGSYLVLVVRGDTAPAP